MKLKTLTVAALVVFGLGLVAPLATGTTTVSAVDPSTKIKEGFTATGDNVQGGTGKGLKGIIKDVVDILLFIIGVLSVIMLIIGGIRYTTSNGNPEQIKAAKSTIMYAVIGLIIAILAFAIVNFVVNNIK